MRVLTPLVPMLNPIAPAASGMTIIAEGSDYRTFRIDELLEDSPATEAGLQKDDVIVAVDGHAATELTLSSLHEMFEKAVPRKLAVRRGSQTLQITLITRRLI